MNGIMATTGGGKGILQFIALIIVFAIVLFITYYVTNWIANYQKGQLSYGNIQIIEVKRIVGNKQIALIKVGEEYFTIGIGKEEINLIGKVDGESITVNEAGPDSFKMIFEKFKEKREKKK